MPSIPMDKYLGLKECVSQTKLRYYASSLSRMRPTSSLAQRIEHRQPVYFLPNEKGQSGATLSALFALRSISGNNSS